MTVYWVVWDAGASWVVDRLERHGRLPGVSRMRRAGTLAAARPARPNCQTPPSLATLFTGTWPHEHGVTGFTVPGAGRGRASHTSGFSSRFPLAPTVWRTAAEHGMTSAFAHAPWVFDAEDRVAPQVEAAVEAYSRRLTRHATWRITARGVPRTWRIGDFPVEVVARRGHGGDAGRAGAAGQQVVLDSGHARVRLPRDGAWRPLALDPVHGTWVCGVHVDGELLLVHTGVWRQRVGGRDAAAVARLTRCPPFAGEGVGPLYRKGAFGPRLAEGGDGSAEEVFLASVGCVARGFAAAADAVASARRADLVVVYLPMTDDVGHELLGWCDPLSAAHRPDLADRAWELIARCYQWSDAILGRLLDRAGPRDTVVLGADHGMVGSSHLVHLNEQLVRAGLARRGPDGALDPAASRVFYHPANNGSLWVGEAAAGDPARAREAMDRARRAIRAITDPATGRSVVAGFLDADGAPERPAPPAPPGSPEPTASDGAPGCVYVALADDFQPTAELSGDGTVVRPVAKSGAHVVNTGDSRLNAVHAAVGPGIAAGHLAGVIDNTEPAALVLRQLGLPARRGAPRPRLTSPLAGTHQPIAEGDR